MSQSGQPKLKPVKRLVPWTDSERAIVRRLFPDYDAMVRAMPHRTRIAVAAYARGMHLTPTRVCRVWKVSEIKQLVEARKARASTAKLLRMFPGLTIYQIRSKSYDVGLRVKPRLKVDDSHPAIISIRKRTEKLGMTLTNLDRQCDSGNYFVRVRERAFAKYVIRAIDVLGGQLSIEWDDS